MLTDVKVRKAQPAEKDYKFSDERGLYLFVTKAGGKSWRMKYRFAGQEKRLTFGRYPEVSLAEARDKRDEARRLLREMIDPALQKRKLKLARATAQLSTFEKVARAWHALQAPRWAPVHADDVLTSMERDLFKSIGNVPIADIDSPMVLEVLRKVERRGAVETARRLRQRISGVFAYAISEGLASSDPAAIVTKALKPLPRKGRQPALTKIEDARTLLSVTEAAGATPVVKLASRLLALTAVRPGVLRGVTWDEFEGIDWEADELAEDAEPLWHIPAQRMKLVLDRKDEEAFDHIVPLAPKAIDVLRAARRLTGRNTLVFPSQRHIHRPMSENAIGYLYNREGYHGRHVPHGWRACFSTIMNERAVAAGRPGDRAIIDLMLAHVPGNRVESAYNRAAYMPKRREIAEEWAELLMKDMQPAAKLLAGLRR